MSGTESAKFTIPFNCPHCGHYTEVDAKFAGETGPCVGCSNTITVPAITSNAIQSLKQHSPAAKLPLIKIGMVVGALISMSVLGIVGWSILQPAFRAARDAARCTECENNLRRIGLAIEDFHNDHNHYPPAVVYDENGKPMHSWRVLILPYLGPQAVSVHEMYDMEEPWDSKENMLLINSMPDVFRCPADAKSVAGETSYLAVVGPNTVINNTPDEPTTRRDVTDVSSETMVVIECAGSALNWLEPKDVVLPALRAGLNSKNPTSPGSQHIQGVNVLMADETIVRLSEFVPSDDLRGMATIDGNEYIESLEQLEY